MGNSAAKNEKTCLANLELRIANLEKNLQDIKKINEKLSKKYTNFDYRGKMGKKIVKGKNINLENPEQITLLLSRIMKHIEHFCQKDPIMANYVRFLFENPIHYESEAYKRDKKISMLLLRLMKHIDYFDLKDPNLAKDIQILYETPKFDLYEDRCTIEDR